MSHRGKLRTTELRKAQGIHEKLGGTGIIGDSVFKPKGMHWRTFERLRRKYEAAEYESNFLIRIRRKLGVFAR